MAESSISWAQDQFTCSICLDLLKDPVTINCGHSFCMSCITDCWDQEDQKRVYSCPQCRQTFTPRPALGKNVILAEMVEKLKKTKLQTDRAAPSYAGAEDVECDVCTGRKHKAVKSCLVCLESYCQTHFERHEELHTGKRHKRLLEDNQRKHQQRIEEKEKKLQDLREAVKTHKSSAQTAVEDTERIFTELIRSIERRRSEVIQLIRDQEKTAVSRAEGLLKELEQEIDDLRRRHEEMKQLSHEEDHIIFLQSFKSLSASPGSTDNIIFSSSLSFDNVVKSVSQLKEMVEDLCKKEIEKISDRVTSIEIIPLKGSKTFGEILSWEESGGFVLKAQVSSTGQLPQKKNKIVMKDKFVWQSPQEHQRWRKMEVHVEPEKQLKFEDFFSVQQQQRSRELEVHVEPEKPFKFKAPRQMW